MSEKTGENMLRGLNSKQMKERATYEDAMMVELRGVVGRFRG